MRVKHTGAKRKRTNTPADQRKRSVAFRHDRRTMLVKVKKASEKNNDSVLDKSSIKNIVSTISVAPFAEKAGNFFKSVKDTVSDLVKGAARGLKKSGKKTDVPAVESVSEEVKDAEAVLPIDSDAAEVKEQTVESTQEQTLGKDAASIAIAQAAKLETTEEEEQYNIFQRSVRWVIRNREEKIAEAASDYEDSIHGLYRAIFLPLGEIRYESGVRHATVGVFASLLVMFIHWMVVGVYPAAFIAIFVDRSAYSFVRMNFTQSATLAFKIGIFFFICEVLLIAVLSVLCMFTRYRNNYDKLFSAVAKGSIHSTILLMIGLVMAYMKHTEWCLWLFASGLVLALFSKTYGIHLNCNLFKWLQVLVLIVCVSLFTHFALIYFKSWFPDVETLLKILLEL